MRIIFSYNYAKLNCSLIKTHDVCPFVLPILVQFKLYSIINIVKDNTLKDPRFSRLDTLKAWY